MNFQTSKLWNWARRTAMPHFHLTLGCSHVLANLLRQLARHSREGTSTWICDSVKKVQKRRHRRISSFSHCSSIDLNGRQSPVKTVSFFLSHITNDSGPHSCLGFGSGGQLGGWYVAGRGRCRDKMRCTKTPSLDTNWRIQTALLCRRTGAILSEDVAKKWIRSRMDTIRS